MKLFNPQGKVQERLEEEVFREDELDLLPPVPKPQPNTLITKGITLSGVLRGEGVVQVEGSIEGEIDIQGSVVVLVGGSVKGPVTADVIQVCGRMEGNVTARQHLRLARTGFVEGDLTAPSLVVEDGGRLNGRTTMLPASPDPLPPLPGPLKADKLDFGPDYQPDEASGEKPAKSGGKQGKKG